MDKESTIRRISVFDTTLRDGEQAPGNLMHPLQKLDLALKIEALGVDYIEAGFPAASAAEFEATQLISTYLSKTKFVSFCRAVRADVEVAIKAGGISENHGIQILATGSDLHLKHKRRISRSEAVAEIVDTITFALSQGINLIFIGIEDASRADLAFLRHLIESAIDAGATNFVIADTVGYSTPQQYGDLISKVVEWVPPLVNISTHCHNDFGLSLANAVAGLQAGANEVQVTLGGIGERAGNTPLEEIAALLHYKKIDLGLSTAIQLKGMHDAYTALRSIIGLEEPRNKAIFGKYVFATAAGIHQQGMLRNSDTYEYIEPLQFGRERSMFITRHSGRSVLRYILEKINKVVNEKQLDELYQKYITNRREGDCEDIKDVEKRLVQEITLTNGA